VGRVLTLDSIASQDTNFVPRMRLLEAAYRDQVARLKEGCCLKDVIWELRDAYRRAHELRPIKGATP
jgi:hypothetical protein